MLWVLGFMGTVILLPFLYLRFHRESWLISITLPLGCGVFFYTLFGLALSMPLYPGILFSKYFG
jgi:predicted branched-subunit amino acid permease